MSQIIEEFGNDANMGHAAITLGKAWVRSWGNLMTTAGWETAMAEKTEPLRIRRELSLKEIHWAPIHHILIHNFNLPPAKVGKMIGGFSKRLSQSLHLGWFRGKPLSSEDNRVLAALCECHGADVLVIKNEKTTSILGIATGFEQTLEFRPNLTRTQSGAIIPQCTPKVTLRMLKKEVVLTSYVHMLVLHALLFFTGVLSYVVIVGTLFYALAVFLLFIFEPVSITVAATKHGHLGLALLCFLAAAAGVLGRAISNLLFRRWRTKEESAPKHTAKISA